LPFARLFTSRRSIEATTTMPTWRKKPANRQLLNKPLAPREYQKRHDAARTATRLLYCEVLEFWRSCSRQPCRRAARCTGEPGACLSARWRDVPKTLHHWAHEQVLAGGPRRIAPANHLERVLRRWPPSSLT
jgi:hypothetical protein